MCASSSNAQEHTARIVEALPDGTYVVEIQGVEFRAISGDRAVELAKQKVLLQACQENEKRFTDLSEIHKRDVVIAEQQTAIEHSNFLHAMQMFETERSLRQEGQQFIPHGQVKGFGGKVLNFLDSGYGQSLFKLVIPTAQFIKVMKQ